MENFNRIKNSGELNLAGSIIPCYVTEDGTRLLSGSKMSEALKIYNGNRQSTKVSQFFKQKAMGNIATQIPSGALVPIVCYKGNQKIYCYKAEALTDICDAMLEIRRNFTLKPKQQRVADQCEILMRSFAKLGLVALIDEATGYQEDRDKGELQRILSAYISDEVAKWQLTFSDEFYRELYRIYNIQPKEGHSKPLRVGYLTAHLIYDRLPDGVFAAMKEKTGKNENGNWKYQLHRNLTESVGRQDLRRIINEVTAIMAISDNKEQFEQLYDRRYNLSATA